MRYLAIIVAACAVPTTAQAQDFWANTLPTITGTDTLSTTLREKETRGGASSSSSSRETDAGGCSIDSLSKAEKDSLYAQYTKIKREQGPARADAWVKVQGRALYNRMAAQGRC